MPPQWRELLEQLGPVFARRSTFRLFTALACGLILADRGTVTGMAAAAGIGRRWRRACWFFSAAAWDPGALGLAVARMIVKYLLSEGEPVTVAVDGTFFRRRGKHVAEARWAYDGAAQGGKKIASGNTRVVAALVVRLRFCPSPAALPVLFRLWRGKGTASQPQLAAQMVKELAEAFPGRVGPRHRGRRVPRRVPGRRGHDVDDAAAGQCGAARAETAAGGQAGAAPGRRETGSGPAPTPRRTRTGAIP